MTAGSQPINLQKEKKKKTEEGGGVTVLSRVAKRLLRLTHAELITPPARHWSEDPQ